MSTLEKIERIANGENPDRRDGNGEVVEALKDGRRGFADEDAAQSAVARSGNYADDEHA